MKQKTDAELLATCDRLAREHVTSRQHDRDVMDVIQALRAFLNETRPVDWTGVQKLPTESV